MFSLLLAALATGPADNALDAAKVEAAVISQRTSIRKGFVSFESVIYQKGAAESTYERSGTIWFDLDKNKYRADVRWTKRGDDRPDRWLDCRNCEIEGYRAFYAPTGEVKGGGSLALTLAPLSLLGATERDLEMEPRTFGISSGTSEGHSRQLKFHNYFAGPNREGFTCREGTYNGSKCLFLSYLWPAKSPEQYLTEAVILPEQGYHVARIKETPLSPADKVAQGTLIESVAARVPGTDRWYPKTVNYERTFHGKMHDKENLRITDVSFDLPLDDKVFTLAGMDIPDGTPILTYKKKGQMEETFWVNQTKKTRQEVAPPPPAAVGTGRDYTSYVIAAVCAILALGALLLYGSRRRSS